MNHAEKTPSRVRILAAAMLLGTLTAGAALAADIKVTLSGANEVPPVTTSAAGSGTITVGDDGAVSGSVMTTGVAGTAAHIHEAAAGKNGPVIVPLTKDGELQGSGWRQGQRRTGPRPQLPPLGARSGLETSTEETQWRTTSTVAYRRRNLDAYRRMAGGRQTDGHGALQYWSASATTEARQVTSFPRACTGTTRSSCSVDRLRLARAP